MQFDSFIKKSLGNEWKNFRKNTVRLSENETLLCEFDEEQVEAFEDISARELFDNVDSGFQVLKHSVTVRDALLHDALTKIDERARNILLMAYWLKMSDLEISDETGISRRTVNYIKNKAYGKLREILEGSGYDASTFFPKHSL
jgi:RNA polymerase sigma factor (sigma-70 family)